MTALPHVVHGEGPHAVVVLAGGNAFVSRFDDSRAQRDAARIARLFPPDTRLCVVGYPSLSDEATGPGLTEIADAVADLLRTAWRGATLAGVSFGGIVALRVALDHPALVPRLVLIASAHRFSTEGQARVERQIAHLEHGDVDRMMRPFLTLCRRPWWNLLMRMALWRRGHTVAERLNAPRQVVALLRAALGAGAELGPRLASLRAPCLVVGGTADQFFGDGAMTTTAQALPNATLTLVPRETHMLPVERPDRVAAAIAAFLARQAS